MHPLSPAAGGGVKYRCVYCPPPPSRERGEMPLCLYSPPPWRGRGWGRGGKFSSVIEIDNSILKHQNTAQCPSTAALVAIDCVVFMHPLSPGPSPAAGGGVKYRCVYCPPAPSRERGDMPLCVFTPLPPGGGGAGGAGENLAQSLKSTTVF